MAITGGARNELAAGPQRFHNATGFASATGTKTASVGLGTWRTNLWAIGPMRKGNDHKQESCQPHRTAAALAHAEGVAERLLRPVDELDYRVRRWLRPVAWGNPLHKQSSIHDLLSHVQEAIGQGLRDEYVVEQSVPDRLANLLREFERQTAGDSYPTVLGLLQHRPWRAC